MSTEIILYGAFPNPYGDKKEKDRETKKLSAIERDLWEPDSEDFLKLAEQRKTAKNTVTEHLETKHVLGFFGAMVKNRKGGERENESIARVDLITHSSPGYIALTGEIELSKSGSLKPTVWFPAFGSDYRFAPAINRESLQALSDDDIAIAKKNTGEIWDLAAIRKKMKPGGKLCVYSCSAALGKSGAALTSFLKDIANLTGLEVCAFTAAIGYRVRHGKIHVRLVWGTEEKPEEGPETVDYRDLDKDLRFFVSAKPS